MEVSNRKGLHSNQTIPSWHVRTHERVKKYMLKNSGQKSKAFQMIPDMATTYIDQERRQEER